MKALNPPVLLIVLLIAAFFLFCAGTNAWSTRKPRDITVGPGDTLWSIAVRSAPEEDPRRTIEEIMSLNSLTTPLIRPGQHLFVP